MFITELKKEVARSTVQLTENGALGFSQTGKALLDMNFRVSSYRNLDEDKIFSDFMKAFNENEIMTMRWLFYVRDIRGGLGERRLFRVITEKMTLENSEMMEKVLGLISEFGRWDDVLVFMGTPIENKVKILIAKQLKEDIENMKKGESISLLAKWMPSINGSNKERKITATKLAKSFGMDQRTYRKTLSELRAYLDIVERKMTTKRWGDIEYSGVPSRANLLYNKAFLRNDEERRREFLGKVEKGEKEIHSATNFPHDIVHKYMSYKAKDQTLEELWKALPNYGEDMVNTLVVADGSGSMTCTTVGNTKILPLSVANALAIYFAEHCVGGFNNTYITFSETPQIVSLGKGTLYSKLKIAQSHNEVANTNIEAVFNLILSTAKSAGMKQEELPATILIISDMEFDNCTNSTGYYGSRTGFKTPNKTLFAELANRYANAEYKLPKLAFWNIMSRTMTIPVIENEAGVTLISGFSPTSINMVLAGEADPYKALEKVLMNERYDVVEEAIS